MPNIKTRKRNQEIEIDLISYIQELERKVEALAQHARALTHRNIELERELNKLRCELREINSPPLLVATVIEVIDENKALVKSSSGPEFVVQVSSKINAKQLKPGTRVALNQRNFALMEVLPTRKEPYIRSLEVIEKPDVSYKDIGGLDRQIEEVREIVELPLLYPELFKEVGIEPPKGILFTGPPGCGKTLLAKAVAAETKATFIRVVASALVQKYIGEGARMVRELFQLAREKAPSIVFIDEIDAIGGKRHEISTSGEREVNRTLTQLLNEMDGFDPIGNIKIIAATNRMDILDPALLRPGRFDRIIEIPPPDEEGRKQIFMIHTRKMNLAPDVNLGILARITENATGAQIKAICTEAGMNAIRERRKQVNHEDFIKAIERILSGNIEKPYYSNLYL